MIESIYWYQVEVFRLPYTKDYSGLLEMKIDEKGLRTDVLLQNNKTDYEIKIGSIVSKTFEIEECHKFGCDLLDNREYCEAMWKERRKT